MENNENFVVETENVEQTTEQTPKMFTQEEVNDIVGKAKARSERKLRREYDQRYGQLEEVLKTGTGKESVEEITDTFRQFYQKKGIQFAEKPQYTEADDKVLAEHDAQNIIKSGFEDVVDEVDRLTAIGFDNLSKREKATFKTLAEHRLKVERGRELAQIGVTEEEFNSPEFQEFSKHFNPNTPIGTMYDIYRKTKPQKTITTLGSMKNTAPKNDGLKDFYTPDEARKFTREELRNNPALMAKIEESMQKWK
jgi:hypothetical protein